MPRNFVCPVTQSLCEDPDCLRTRCVLAAAAKHEAAVALAEAMITKRRRALLRVLIEHKIVPYMLTHRVLLNLCNRLGLPEYGSKGACADRVSEAMEKYR